MNQTTRLILFSILYFFVILLIPAFIVNKENLVKSEPIAQKTVVTPEIQEQETPEDQELMIAVLRDADQTVESIDLESYVAGVVASEMPASFEIEALKAQALAARTYVTRILAEGAPELPGGAEITDTTTHQVYKNKEELKAIWKDDFDWKMKKIEEAVQETKGEIITYGGEPITASFFSTSNGWTENAGDYWNEDIPYLKSVESKWDREVAPGYEERVTISLGEFQQKLGITLAKGEAGNIIERTPGNRVKTIEIGGKTFSGREIREALNLRSSDFNWLMQGDQVVIETRGYGHGVGMSQYGANGMALEGKKYTEIVAHYFKDITISPIEQAVPSLVAHR
ncbi:stage II sporulation protein D [Jeotgalibacillus sp. R-1-5s-1]|uniref:stage II sporulation protein D n=1 Tax=Jeotgalibacillus sp. R-1-5s-1 TaxID=2555897 RepID=UPI00106A0DAE|nr:stage II sporulation protein D [Jeotgalibacillus sp. R-1-5s-1]TFD97011.1 stage II sporulation protein D [Jeotgalibacillus sp. R-1-5s-1]